MSSPLQLHSPLAYQPLEAELRADISNGRLQAGDKLCPEVTLARRYGISRGTVRIALDNLVRDGLLKKIQGSGTFVSGLPEKHSPKQPQILFISLASTLSRETFFHSGTYLPILDGLMTASRRHHCNLLISHIETDLDVPPCLSKHEVQGVLFHGSLPLDFYHRWIRPLPNIAVQYSAPEKEGLCIKGDNLQFSRLAVEKLVELGCRRIGFVSNEIEMPVSRERYHAYLMALAEHHLPSRPEYSAVWQRPGCQGILPNETEIADYRPYLQPMFSSPKPPDALICVDDWRARCTLAALEKMHLRVPEDVCVIGGNNGLDFAGVPKISGFNFKLKEICFQAMELLLARIQGRINLQGTFLLSPEFQDGDTTAGRREFPKKQTDRQ